MGGNATCEGKAALDEPDGVATAVESVKDGAAVSTVLGAVDVVD